jgi:DNA-binding PadR family transcriptional regulator
MWLGKFLDLKADISQEIKDMLSKSFEPKKLTPLEFTILESIFNAKQISKEDLIEILNKHFAGTFEAKSITIYPLLSKLKSRGFLDSKEVKSLLGPLVKVYHLTTAGEEVLKTKVSKNFLDQMKFIENFLIELSSIYIKSFPPEERDVRLQEVENLVKLMFETVTNKIPTPFVLESRCKNCNALIDRENSKYCSNCGELLL